VRVAFVSPFFGADAAGGAESECRNTAIRLASSGIDVEILTTCARDLQHNWNLNYHRQGVFREDSLTIRRFRTEYVNLTAFKPLNSKIIQGDTLTGEEEKQFMAMHVNCFDLYRYLSTNGNDYDWICFIPYLFGTTVYGSMINPEKSILIPCLHDEGYARMHVVKELFWRCARIVFHAHSELELAERLYGKMPGRSMVIGEGIDTELTSDAGRFRSNYNMTDPFVLYVGRKDEEKNVHTLIRYFAAYKKARRNNLRLVLIGPAAMPIPADMRSDIIDIGFVPAQDKNDAYSAAMLLCQPSLNESFSIVMMESWLCKTPCLVSERCAVTREHVRRSGGGLYFNNYPDFEGCLDYLMEHGDMRQRMGETGRKYVTDNFAWDNIIRKYKKEVFADGY